MEQRFQCKQSEASVGPWGATSHQGSGTARARGARVISRTRPHPEARPTKLSRSPDTLKTSSGLDITQNVAELLWVACEQGYLAFETIRQSFSGAELTPEDLTSICRTLEQVGVQLIDACDSDSLVPSAHGPPGTGPDTRSSPLMDWLMQRHRSQSAPCDPEPEVLNRLKEAEADMRGTVCGFAFAAPEHIARARDLLARPSKKNFDKLVVEAAVGGRAAYLEVLPNLVSQLRELHQRTTTEYAKWRSAIGREDADKYQTEFGRLSLELQQTLPRFHYQSTMIREIAVKGYELASRLQDSLRILEHGRQYPGSVAQLPLLDVEQQNIEGVEELVRMPYGEFLRICDRLRAAEAKYQLARCELIQRFLPLVTSVSVTCPNQGLTLAELLREGILGLIRAVEQFEYQHDAGFSTYAARLIRQSVYDALAARTHRGPRPLPSRDRPGNNASGQGDTCSDATVSHTGEGQR